MSFTCLNTRTSSSTSLPSIVAVGATRAVTVNDARTSSRSESESSAVAARGAIETKLTVDVGHTMAVARVADGLVLAYSGEDERGVLRVGLALSQDGVVFREHPDLRRILMYPEFVGHPLRKDYPAHKAQPLIDYRTEEEAGLPLEKLAPFGPDEGMSFGRRTYTRSEEN